MKVLSILFVALFLTACATKPGTDSRVVAQQTVDQITIGYGVIRSAAILCISGVVCKDEGIIAALKPALATADLGVTEATRLILANAEDTSATVKYANIAMAAITVLTKALQSYGVKL